MGALGLAAAGGELTRLKRATPRWGKTAESKGSFVATALGFILIKSAR